MTPKSPSATSGAHVDEWQALVLSDMLHGLHRYVERKSGIKLSPEQQAELDRFRGSKGGPFSTTLSQAKRFMIESGGDLIGLMMSKGGAAIQNSTQKSLLKLATRVETAIAGEERALGFYLPDFSDAHVKRWPGPVGYRVAVNHLVAVSIRLHSIFPSVSFRDVIGVVGKAVIVPILAHNLTFVARSHPQVFKQILRTLDGLGKDEEPELEAAFSDEELDLYRRWRRLIDCTVKFSPDQATARSAIREVVDLVNEHGDNPSSSKLWSGLSVFASGDLAIDELLVAKVIKENDYYFSATENTPLVNCARSKFGLLRYSYAMEEEKQLIAVNLPKALDHAKEVIQKVKGLTRPEHLDDAAAREAFGWAYLLSRKILLGRRRESEAEVNERRKTSKVLDELLAAVSAERFRKAHSLPVRIYGMLALRYRAGFRSNPRFIADTNAFDIANYIEGTLDNLKSETEIPVGIVYMVKARNSLHQAFIKRAFGDDKRANLELDHAIAHYGMTLDSVIGHGFKFDETRERLKNVAGVMDGEVAAWCIPEMVMALRMKREMAVGREEKESLKRLSTALAVVGEAKYGIYFNEEEESARIRCGLEMRCRRKL